MVSFVSWMKDQEKSEGDPVGWFARFWRDLEGKPRLSSPASIAKYLEDKGLFQATNGLTEAYDATLGAYRAVRAGVVRDAAQADGVQLPLPEHQPGAAEPERGLAGQAVDRATEAAVAAAQLHAGGITSPPGMGSNVVITSGNAALGTSEALLAAIYRKLSRIEQFLGLETDEDGGAVPAQLPWSNWYEQAAVYATARGAGWDTEAGA